MGFGKDGQGQILYDSYAEGLGAIPTKDAIIFTNDYDGVLVEDFRIIKVDYWLSIGQSTPTVTSEGPVLIGIASGDLSAAKIEEALEAVPLNRNSTALELSMRPVWPLEVFQLTDLDLGVQSDQTRKGSINLRWTFENPSGWTWFAYNFGGGAITTGLNAAMFAKIFGMWVS